MTPNDSKTDRSSPACTNLGKTRVYPAKIDRATGRLDLYKAALKILSHKRVQNNDAPRRKVDPLAEGVAYPGAEKPLPKCQEMQTTPTNVPIPLSLLHVYRDRRDATPPDERVRVSRQKDGVVQLQPLEEPSRQLRFFRLFRACRGRVR